MRKGSNVLIWELPWIEHESVKFRREFHETVRRSFPAVKSRMIFTTVHAFSGRAKDVFPATGQSLLVYKYRCCCAQWAHLCWQDDLTLYQENSTACPEKPLTTSPTLEGVQSDSIVTPHLKESSSCISHETCCRFKILAKARSESYLNVLETLFISKFLPILCCQEDFNRVFKKLF